MSDQVNMFERAVPQQFLVAVLGTRAGDENHGWDFPFGAGRQSKCASQMHCIAIGRRHSNHHFPFGEPLGPNGEGDKQHGQQPKDSLYLHRIDSIM